MGLIMGPMASQITSLTIVYSTVYSGADQRKHQSSPSLAFVREIHRWPVNSPHKGPVTRKMFPFDDVFMWSWCLLALVVFPRCKPPSWGCWLPLWQLCLVSSKVNRLILGTASCSEPVASSLRQWQVLCWVGNWIGREWISIRISLNSSSIHSSNGHR